MVSHAHPGRAPIDATFSLAPELLRGETQRPPAIWTDAVDDRGHHGVARADRAIHSQKWVLISRILIERLYTSNLQGSDSPAK
jgi:hypothetical protein